MASPSLYTIIQARTDLMKSLVMRFDNAVAVGIETQKEREHALRLIKELEEEIRKLSRDVRRSAMSRIPSIAEVAKRTETLARESGATPEVAKAIGEHNAKLALEEALEPEIPACPTCGGGGAPMGALGNRMHFRCTACGIDFSTT